MIDNLSETAKGLIEEINSEATPSQTINDLAYASLIPQGIDIPKPDVVFQLNDIPIFTKKSLSTLIGKAKSGKTTCTAWIIAQTILQRLSVVWIDTEQGLYYGSRTQFWVLTISGIRESQFLKFYDLKIHNPTVRIQIVELLIQEIRPDIVVIDGIRDLVFDINAPEEATITVGNLMKWADLYDCHILSILHQNKGNEHARGHLGSEMINKSESVIKVTKDENNFTVCEPEFTRGEMFTSFAFERDINGIPFLSTSFSPNININSDSNAKKVSPTEIDKIQHYKILNQAFGEEKKVSYSDLISSISAAFDQHGVSIGVVKTKGFISFYIQNGYLQKVEKVSNKTFYSIKYDGTLTKVSSGNEPIQNDDAPF